MHRAAQRLRGLTLVNAAAAGRLRNCSLRIENEHGMAIDVGDFGQKLTLVLKALSVSRARLAASVGVDKSVAGRWCAGTVTPSAYNLERLTAYVAEHIPGFTMLDWERDLAGLATRLGVTALTSDDMTLLLQPQLIEEARGLTRLRGATYEGIWRSTRYSDELRGFVHDYSLLRVDAGGILRYRLGVFHLRLDGWILPIDNQMFSMASDAGSGVVIFSILHGVTGRKAMRLDGLSITSLRNRGGDIVASPVIFERAADLTGDIATDDACFEAFMAANPLATDPDVPHEIANHLLPDIGPKAAAANSGMTLMMAFATSLSRSAMINTLVP